MPNSDLFILIVFAIIVTTGLVLFFLLRKPWIKRIVIVDSILVFINIAIFYLIPLIGDRALYLLWLMVIFAPSFLIDLIFKVVFLVKQRKCKE